MSPDIVKYSVSGKITQLKTSGETERGESYHQHTVSCFHVYRFLPKTHIICSDVQQISYELEYIEHWF